MLVVVLVTPEIRCMRACCSWMRAICWACLDYCCWF